MKRRICEIGLIIFVVYLALIIFQPFLPHSIAGVIQAIIPQAVPTSLFQGTATSTSKFQGARGTTANGDCPEYDSTGLLIDSGIACGGATGTAGATLFSSTSTATVTAATATTLIGTVTGSTTIAANTWTAGSVTHLKAQGYYTTPAVARTLTINLNLAGSPVLTTGIFTVIASVTTGTWQFDCIITTRTTGSSGTQIGDCQFSMTGALLAAPGIQPMHVSSAWSVNTTTTNAIDFQAAWDSTTGSPSISCSGIAAWIPGAPVTSVNGNTGAVNAFDLLSPYKNTGTVTGNQIKASSVVASGSLTLLSLSGAPGYVSQFWLGITYTDSASATASTLSITIDGGSAQTIRLPLYFGAEYLYNTCNFRNVFIGGQQNNSTNVGMYSYLPIPFSSSITISVTNGSSSSSMTVWTTINAQTGVSDTWPNMHKLWFASGTTNSIGVNQTQTLVNVSGLNPGRLAGVYMSIDAGSGGNPNPRTAGLEGRVKYYLDGTGPQFQSSGTDDYFNSSNYFEGLPDTAGTNMGCSQAYFSAWDAGYTGLQFYNNQTNVFGTVNAYRFHIQDPVTFQNALEITWDAGYSTVVNYTGTYRFAWAVWYYTQ